MKAAAMELIVQARRELAPIAAAGAWNMGHWGDMQQYVNAIEPNREASTSATAFLRAVLDVHNDEWTAAKGTFKAPQALTL